MLSMKQLMADPASLFRIGYTGRQGKHRSVFCCAERIGRAAAEERKAAAANPGNQEAAQKAGGHEWSAQKAGGREW